MPNSSNKMVIIQQVDPETGDPLGEPRARRVAEFGRDTLVYRFARIDRMREVVLADPQGRGVHRYTYTTRDKTVHADGAA